MMGNSFGLLTPSSPCPLTSALGFLSGTLTPGAAPPPRLSRPGPRCASTLRTRRGSPALRFPSEPRARVPLPHLRVRLPGAGPRAGREGQDAPQPALRGETEAPRSRPPAHQRGLTAADSTPFTTNVWYPLRKELPGQTRSCPAPEDPPRCGLTSGTAVASTTALHSPLQGHQERDGIRWRLRRAWTLGPDRLDSNFGSITDCVTPRETVGPRMPQGCG
ncbi:uncharacterized protein LOC105236000 [Ailuropoda melanoleuca]|uniref:uncharacterized protein LOC105236000 n=1 Tax=Ailuropoda melanoleuca TaxID=9646 RepID=UPI001494EFD9|nr:uncharacterized protein LOC105236000 [Ailuropoda melanoleuca]